MSAYVLCINPWRERRREGKESHENIEKYVTYVLVPARVLIVCIVMYNNNIQKVIYIYFNMTDFVSIIKVPPAVVKIILLFFFWCFFQKRCKNGVALHQ